MLESQWLFPGAPDGIWKPGDQVQGAPGRVTTGKCPSLFELQFPRKRHMIK